MKGKASAAAECRGFAKTLRTIVAGALVLTFFNCSIMAYADTDGGSDVDTNSVTTEVSSGTTETGSNEATNPSTETGTTSEETVSSTNLFPEIVSNAQNEWGAVFDPDHTDKGTMGYEEGYVEEKYFDRYTGTYSPISIYVGDKIHLNFTDGEANGQATNMPEEIESYDYEVGIWHNTVVSNEYTKYFVATEDGNGYKKGDLLKSELQSDPSTEDISVVAREGFFIQGDDNTFSYVEFYNYGISNDQFHRNPFATIAADEENPIRIEDNKLVQGDLVIPEGYYYELTDGSYIYIAPDSFMGNGIYPCYVNSDKYGWGRYFVEKEDGLYDNNGDFLAPNGYYEIVYNEETGEADCAYYLRGHDIKEYLANEYYLYSFDENGNLVCKTVSEDENGKYEYTEPEEIAKVGNYYVEDNRFKDGDMVDQMLRFNDFSFVIPNETPVWDGHEFMGWATTSDAVYGTYEGPVYQPGDSFVTYFCTTLHALWKALTGNTDPDPVPPTNEDPSNPTPVVPGTTLPRTPGTPGGGGGITTTAGGTITPTQMTTLDENGNPLGVFDAGHGYGCWVHWWILLGMLICSASTVIILNRREAFITKLVRIEEDIVGNRSSESAEAVPAYELAGVVA